MNMEESTCMRNCHAKLDTMSALTLEGTKAQKFFNKNKAFLKKHDPEFKNYDYDPLTKELDRFKGKFYGNVDRPLI
eukprot:CAMPEP_0197001406 /NCGR_PEP_ID=MMETSP1380-20130617/6110_1 /TAXON_ID=5936 /ORGANISM="Euplotes crassus, Strain CT5" /LENGTH=75 /DNA_ID=CAMNT_0042419061 /DNA_START=257 /DNA_END=484 /DNA_ORIENTATION=+